MHARSQVPIRRLLPFTSASMTLPIPPPGDVSNAFFTATVTSRRQAVELRLRGEIDVAAAPELTRTLEGLDGMSAMPLHVAMADVTFLDTAGVWPLVEAARRRRDYDWPPLLIGSISRPAKRLLTVSGLGE